MKKKRLMVAALAVALTIGSTMSSYAAWVESGAEWRYQNDDGSWKASTWFEEAGKKYHFDMNGNAQKGWFKETDGKWYFFGYNGVMQTGLIKVDDKVYFMNDDGSLFIGTKKIGKADYNFTEYGTTNGQPQVVPSQTWAGNGNQTNVVKGGGGYSSFSGSNEPTVKDEVKNKVDEIISGVKDSVSETVTVAVTGNSIKFNTTAESAKVAVKDSGLVSEAENAIKKLFNSNEDVQEVTVAGKTYNRDTVDNIDLNAAIVRLGFEDKSVEDLIKMVKKDYSKSVEIVTSDGTLNYTFQ
ncbi:cell wall-binding protein [Clostridium boliviensis]|uniref:Cell wall-binding protein n=1 Tax=Clostridium boliviensis TaxID=318465 RepID=A0ABU4GQ48_9CLOT|nr:cell wall-binding protein [Clostridium boliviensis]MDW2799750.1 cell wall-binding protein [Clostridium boliviensis]